MEECAFEEVLAKDPQGLKPQIYYVAFGTAEAVPSRKQTTAWLLVEGLGVRLKPCPPENQLRDSF